MKFAEQLEQIVKNRIEKDTLTLPTLPAVAFKAIELIRAPEFNIQDVASLIEKRSRAGGPGAQVVQQRRHGHA